MKAVRFVLLAALLAGLTGFLIYVGGLRAGPGAAQPPAPADAAAPALAAAGIVPVEFTDAAQCKACHPDTCEEWSKDEHSNSYSEEVYRKWSGDYGMVECISCHAPQPVLEAGLGMVARTREFNRMSGVDCLTCHVKAGRAHGKRGSGAPCAGPAVPEIGTEKACFPCHSTHNLLKEFEETPAAFKKGRICQDCHMEKVVRPVAAGSPARETRRHVFLGGHDLATLKKAVELNLKTEGSDMLIEVTNVGAAHGVPGEINNRILQCEASVIDEKGDEVNLVRVEFQAPPRLLRNKIPSSQIMPGETRRLRFPLGARKGRATVTLRYKLEAEVLNHEAAVVAVKAADF